MFWVEYGYRHRRRGKDNSGVLQTLSWRGWQYRQDARGCGLLKNSNAASTFAVDTTNLTEVKIDSLDLAGGSIIYSFDSKDAYAYLSVAGDVTLATLDDPLYDEYDTDVWESGDLMYFELQGITTAFKDGKTSLLLISRS